MNFETISVIIAYIYIGLVGASIAFIHHAMLSWRDMYYKLIKKDQKQYEAFLAWYTAAMDAGIMPDESWYDPKIPEDQKTFYPMPKKTIQ